jgi:hypothetical protein
MNKQEKAKILSAESGKRARVICPYCEAMHNIKCLSMTEPWNEVCIECEKVYEVDIDYFMNQIIWAFQIEPDPDDE